jgi:outer membrane protein TolC
VPKTLRRSGLLAAAFALAAAVPNFASAAPPPPTPTPTATPTPTPTATPTPTPFTTPTPATLPSTPLTLAEALARAQEHLVDFALSAERRVKAELLWDRAVAALQPSLTASATVTLAKPINSAFGEIRPLDSETGGASLTLSLFDGRAFAGAAAAHALRASERSAAERDEEEARLTVIKAYYAALAADELARVAERTVAAAEAHLADATARRESGAALALDVTRAKLELTKARSAVVTTRADAAGARALVALLCGLDGDVALAAPAPPALPGGSDPSELERKAEEARPDLRAAALAVEAERKKRAVAYWALAPTVSVTGSTSVTANPSVFNTNPDYSVAFRVSWLVYDGGGRYADMKEEAAALKVAAAAVAELRARVRMEVRNALRDLDASRATLASLADEVSLARETLAMAEERYRAGVGSGLEVVEATQSVTDAESALVRAELDAQLRAVDLLRALGDDLSALAR